MAMRVSLPPTVRSASKDERFSPAVSALQIPRGDQQFNLAGGSMAKGGTARIWCWKSLKNGQAPGQREG